MIEGREAEISLPAEGPDELLAASTLADMQPEELWRLLAPHPRPRQLMHEMSRHGVSLTDAGKLMFGPECGERREDTQSILDAMASAREKPDTPGRLQSWRAHLFHRALGGLWVCIDPGCSHRDPELAADPNWGFGAVWLRQRDRCQCGAQVFELAACDECGTAHLLAGMEAGAAARLIPIRAGEIDDFAVDVEPETETDDLDIVRQGAVASEKILLRPSRGDARDRFVRLENGMIFDDTPPEGGGWIPVTLIEDETARDCCGGATEARLQPLRFAPQFFMGNELPILMEALAPPLDQPGLPMGGRRALSFSDSRQGTARLAAKLQQDAERMLTRAFLYHAVQEDHGPKGEERTRLEVNLEKYRRNPDDWPDEIRDLEKILTGTAKPVPWNDLVDRLAQHAELLAFATGVWRERTRGGREMAEDPAKLAEMFLYRGVGPSPKSAKQSGNDGIAPAYLSVAGRANTQGHSQTIT